MSGFRTFAVAGAGDMGRFIVDELLNHLADGSVSSVVVLSRSSTGDPELEAKGAKYVQVDYTSPASLEAALKGIDAVISTLSTNALTAQTALVDAAKAAGVKLLVPSEFGNPTIGKTHSIFGIKNGLRNHMEDIGLPWVAFFTGLFSDWIFIPEWGFDFEHDKAILRGSGNTPVSFTTRTDIARYVVYVLLHLTQPELHNAVFRIEGERTTFRKILEDYQTRTGKKLEIIHETREFLEKVVTENPEEPDAVGKGNSVNAYVRMLFLEWDKGEGVAGKPEEINKYWAEWNPMGVVDAIIKEQQSKV